MYLLYHKCNLNLVWEHKYQNNTPDDIGLSMDYEYWNVHINRNNKGVLWILTLKFVSINQTTDTEYIQYNLF